MEKLPNGLVTIVNLPGTGSILHRSWHLYTRHFGQFASFAVLFGVGLLVNGGLATGIEYLTKSGGGLVHALSQVVISAVGIITAFYATFIFAGFVVFLNQLRHGKELTISAALEEGKTNVKSVFWVAIIATFALYGSLFTGILFVLFSFWYYFALYISIVDGERGVAALAKSRYLTHGLFWKIAGRYVAIIALLFTLYFLAYIALGIPVVGWIVFLLLLLVISFCALPFFLIYDFIRFIDIAAVQRTVEFTQYRGERAAITVWSVLGCIFFSFVWCLGLLTTESQERFIQTTAIQSARVVLPFAKAVETNVQKIQEIFGVVPAKEKTPSQDALDNLKNLLEETKPLDEQSQ